MNANMISAFFRANLAKFEDSQLTRELICAVMDQTAAQCQSTPPVSVAASVSASGGKKGASAVPDQWSRIFSSKEYGVCAYPLFKTVYEEMKKTRSGLGYFTAVSEIRTLYESKPEWQGYLSWVRERHPNKDAVAKDPSPRKATSTAGGVVSVPALPPTVPSVQDVPMVPTVPTVPTLIPQVF